MSNGRKYEKPCTYQIKVKGTLTSDWSGWFEGFSISPQAKGETLLTGTVADQAALHGLLARIAGLGMPLLSVTRQEGPMDNGEISFRMEGENKNEYRN